MCVCVRGVCVSVCGCVDVCVMMSSQQVEVPQIKEHSIEYVDVALFLVDILLQVVKNESHLEHLILCLLEVSACDNHGAAKLELHHNREVLRRRAWHWEAQDC